jgi:hypothetical protein
MPLGLRPCASAFSSSNAAKPFSSGSTPRISAANATGSTVKTPRLDVRWLSQATRTVLYEMSLLGALAGSGTAAMTFALSSL